MDDPLSNAFSGIASAFSGFIKGLGQRLLVHFCSLMGAGLVGSTLSDGTAMGSGGLSLCAYIGLICLVPRGMGNRADWLIPSGSGLALILFWSFWGVPWQFCLIWGGALTFTVRALMKQGLMGWEWSALPWLFLALYAFFSQLLPASPVTPPYLSFPVLALAAWGALRLLARLRGDPVQTGMLAEACAALEKLVASRSLAPELVEPASRLARAGRALLERKPRLGPGSAALTRDMAKAPPLLKRLGALPSMDKSREVQTELSRLDKQLRAYAQSLEPKDEETKEAIDPVLAGRIKEFRGQAGALAQKSGTLPEDMRRHIDGIAASTENILACMAADPQDAAPGDRFLSRYLKAAHTVVDEYARLAAQGGAHAEAAEALGRSREIMARLEQAFAEEHANLLRNDTVNLTAELNVLDKLLKMDGR